jgi:hypothetical protein
MQASAVEDNLDLSKAEIMPTVRIFFAYARLCFETISNFPMPDSDIAKSLFYEDYNKAKYDVNIESILILFYQN